MKIKIEIENGIWDLKAKSILGRGLGGGGSGGVRGGLTNEKRYGKIIKK